MRTKGNDRSLNPTGYHFSLSFFSLLLAPAFLSACASGSRIREATLAPAFSLKDGQGKIVHLSDFRGRPVLLDFWATWCDSCRQSIPLYENIQRKHAKQGLAVIGICEGGHVEAIRRFALRRKISYPVLLDSADEAEQAYDIYSIPTTILVGPDGRILKRWDGFDDNTAAEILARIESLLEPRRRVRAGAD